MSVRDLIPRIHSVNDSLDFTSGKVRHDLLHKDIPYLALVVSIPCPQGRRHEPDALVHEIPQAEVVDVTAAHHSNDRYSTVHRRYA